MKWTVVGQVTISITTEVEATSRRQAMMLASARPIAQVHVPNSCDPSEEWVPGEELDGEPVVISAERN